MVPIKVEAIETFIAQAERSGVEYYKKIANEMSVENRPLFDILYKNAERVASALDNLAEDGIMSEAMKEFVAVNVMSAAIATYQTIATQLEANTLTEMFGPIEKEKNEERTQA